MIKDTIKDWKMSLKIRDHFAAMAVEMIGEESAILIGVSIGMPRNKIRDEIRRWKKFEVPTKKKYDNEKISPTPWRT